MTTLVSDQSVTRVPILKYDRLVGVVFPKLRILSLRTVMLFQNKSDLRQMQMG